MTKKIKTERMKLDKESMEKQIQNRMEMLSQLTTENILSMLDFTMMICGTYKPDVFVTVYDMLLDNRDQIEANIGIKVMTLEEAVAYAESEGSDHN